MAKVYAPPDDIELPSISGSNWQDDYRRYEQEIVDFCKQNGKGPYAGKMIRDQVADGYAVYYILSLRPLVLILSQAFDAYRSRWDERWQVEDVKNMADREEALRQLFSQKQAV